MAKLPSERTRITIRLIDKGIPFLGHLVKWGALFGIVYLATDAIGKLAGQHTEATLYVLVNFVTTTGVGQAMTVSLIAGLVGVLYGLFERRLRSSKVEYLEHRIRELETFLAAK